MASRPWSLEMGTKLLFLHLLVGHGLFGLVFSTPQRHPSWSITEAPVPRDSPAHILPSVSSVNAGVGPTSPSSGTSPKICSGLAEKPVILDCQGSPPSSYCSSGTSAATALHIVSVYETRSDHSFGYHPTGSAFVDFALPGANVLVLSSYEPTHWTVSMGSGASLEKIITIGYHQQTVTLRGSTTNVPVQPSKNTECGYSLPYRGGGCDTNTLIYAVLQETGLRLASFDGCYRATRFKLHQNCSRSLEPNISSAPQTTRPTPIEATTDAYSKPSVDAGAIPTSPSSSTSAKICSGLAEKPVILDCQGSSPSSYRSSGTSAATALHIVSVYETRSDHSFGYHPTGSAFVDFALPGANVLVLSSYEPTHWTVSTAQGASLEKIITIGYHQQTVTLVGSATNVPVQPSKSRKCGYSLPYNGGGCDTDMLISTIRQETGLSLASFDGCYRATRFKLHQNCSRSFEPSISSAPQTTRPTPIEATTDAYPKPTSNAGVSPTSPSSSTSPKLCSRLAEKPVILDCQGSSPSSYRSSGTSAATALHIVSVYETRSDHSFGYHPTGSALVDFALPGANVLVLSSYEPTHWTVSMARGASLEKIITIGYHQQTVTLAGSATIVPVQPSKSRKCGYSLPYNGGGCDTDMLISTIRQETGLSLASFDGCYRATRFKLHQNCSRALEPSITSALKPLGQCR